MSRLAQNLNRLAPARRLDEYVIRVEGRKRKDANARVGERRGQRRENAGQREIQWPDDLERAPIALAFDSVRHIRLRAYNRKFVARARDGEKIAARPRGDRRGRGEAADGESIG